MTAGMQNCSFIGRTKSDMDFKFIGSAVPVANFDLAVEVENENGKKRVDFIPCVLWNEDAKHANDNIGKGTELYIEGEFRSRKQGYINFDIDYSKTKIIDLKPVGGTDNGGTEEGTNERLEVKEG